MTQTQEQLEKILRKCSLDKLTALQVIADYDGSVIDTTTLSGTLDQKGTKLGGTISSLTRTKIDGIPLLLPAGRTNEDGILWKLNPDVAPKDIVKKLVDQILDESKDYLAK